LLILQRLGGFVSVDEAFMQYASQVSFRIYFLYSCLVNVDNVDFLDAGIADFFPRYWRLTVVFVAEVLDELDVCERSFPRGFS